ncbi:MAG: hypothetical protein N3I35_17515 [Clostridia bacterium]|nr:hypothetical protein [Clostridia bacterium]
MGKEKLSVKCFINNKGSTPIIIICTTLIVILGSAVIADIAYAAVENFRLKKGAEKSARYGAELLITDRSNAENMIRKYAVKTISELNELDINISGNSKELTVKLEKPFGYIFLQLIGFKEKQIKAKCTARVSNVCSVVGIRPFAITRQKFIYGKEYVLSNKKSDENIVSIIPIDLGKRSLKANIVYGYRKSLQVGDGVYALKDNIYNSTKEGFKTFFEIYGDTKKNYSGSTINEKMIVILPVVDKFGLSGESTMEIKGFTAFFIKGFEEYKGYIKLRGTFLRKTIKGSTSDGIEDFGLTGIRIVH